VAQFEPLTPFMYGQGGKVVAGFGSPVDPLPLALKLPWVHRRPPTEAPAPTARLTPLRAPPTKSVGTFTVVAVALGVVALGALVVISASE
jgi:hypothetical protein